MQTFHQFQNFSYVKGLIVLLPCAGNGIHIKCFVNFNQGITVCKAHESCVCQRLRL